MADAHVLRRLRWIPQSPEGKAGLTAAAREAGMAAAVSEAGPTAALSKASVIPTQKSAARLTQ